MRAVAVSGKLIGEKVGKDTYSDYGRLLLGKGVVLTNSLIFKLKNCEINYIYIDDEFSEGINPKGIINDHMMLQSINKVKTILTKIADRDAKGVKKLIPEKELEAVQSVVSSLIEALEESKNALYTVVELMGADMYTYKHSVNVAVLTILTCKSLGYDYALTKKIALGALLHDIGKAAISENILKKPDTLTKLEFEKIREHSELGYNMIKDDISLSGYTKQVVRLHHEKRDGSGYPLGLKETEIPDFVRIVTICDMYDAMTNNRIYRRKMPIYIALEILMADSVFKLDSALLQIFTKNICVYPPGVGILMEDGRTGVVVSYNVNNPTRPVIRLHIEDANEYEDINMEENRTIFIKSIIQE